jgi:diguanylate cyclase (GGDEF)-like protein
LIVLLGPIELRPDGLERQLLSAGFQVAEAEDPDHLPGRPAAVLVVCAGFTPECSELVQRLATARSSGAQVVVLLPDGAADDLLRAIESGADEAIVLPIEADLMIARIAARIAAPRGSTKGPLMHDLRLFEVLQQVAVELHRDDMLHALVRGLAHALDGRWVSCLLHQPGAATGLMVADSEVPKLRDADTLLENWPEAVSAVAGQETVYLRDAAADRLFLPASGKPGFEIVSTAAIPLCPLGRPIGSVVLRSRRGEPLLTAGQVALAELAVGACARLIETDDRRGAISRRQAIAGHVDSLTGCGTLDALDRRIREEFERARRYDVAFALVLLDVDAMRVINDQLGRDGGHRVLAELGRLLQRELRAPDFVARYGGEEFLLLLPETDLDGARLTVDRIRNSMGPAGLSDLNPGVRCRLSAGIAIFPHPAVHKPEDMFALVESALVEGKRHDGDRIGTAA